MPPPQTATLPEATAARSSATTTDEALCGLALCGLTERKMAQIGPSAAGACPRDEALCGLALCGLTRRERPRIGPGRLALDRVVCEMESPGRVPSREGPAWTTIPCGVVDCRTGEGAVVPGSLGPVSGGTLLDPGRRGAPWRR